MKPAERIRLLLGLSVVATLCAFGVSFWLHWPWLRGEHDRLEPAYRVLIWSGDTATLLWLVWFGIRYSILRYPLPKAAGGDAETRYLVASLLVAFGIDLAITAITAYDEETGRRRALQVQGQIVGGRPTVNGHKAYIACRFQDQAGVWRESHLQVVLPNQPQGVRNAVQVGRLPVPVLVSYDPQWPQRCWLDGFDNQEDNRLHWMSASFLLFQVLSMPLALQFGVWKTAGGAIPLYKVIPLWAELLPFFLAAMAKFCEGEC